MESLHNSSKLLLVQGLEKVWLDFEDCGLSDLEVSAIAEGLEKKSRLRRVYVNLKDNRHIVCPGFIELFKALKENVAMKSMYIDISGIH